MKPNICITIIKNQVSELNMMSIKLSNQNKHLILEILIHRPRLSAFLEMAVDTFHPKSYELPDIYEDINYFFS